MKERTRVETRSNSISSPLQGSQIRLSPAGRPLITTAYRPFGHGPTGSFCKGDDVILAGCPSIALALTPSPASHGHIPRCRRGGATRTSTRTGCPPVRAPATLCAVPKASVAGNRSSALVEQIHQAHCRAYVPTHCGQVYNIISCMAILIGQNPPLNWII
jgi:hypothetical protein